MRVVKIQRVNDRKTWGCVRTRNRTNWCYALCAPKKGIGDCGRVAPHGLRGRTQEAILEYKRTCTE